MNYMNKLFLLIVFLLRCNISFCQWETRSIRLPFVKSSKKELNAILDSVFIAEQRCGYYSDTLMLGISIIVNPDDNKMYSLNLESQNRKQVMLGLKPLAYFEHMKHNCFIYNYIPYEFFDNTDSLYTFYYQFFNTLNTNKIKLNETPTLNSIEDDSFSQWEYYFYKDQFHFYRRYSYCDK